LERFYPGTGWSNAPRRPSAPSRAVPFDEKEGYPAECGLAPILSGVSEGTCDSVVPGWVARVIGRTIGRRRLTPKPKQHTSIDAASSQGGYETRAGR